jgi:hypothetical protein
MSLADDLVRARTKVEADPPHPPFCVDSLMPAAATLNFLQT